MSAYQNLITEVTNDIEANAAQAPTCWLGWFLDEESDFGFASSELAQMHGWLATNVLSFTPGGTWFAVQTFTSCSVVPQQQTGDPVADGCTWKQSDYNALVQDSLPAPEMAVPDMPPLANGSRHLMGRFR